MKNFKKKITFLLVLLYLTGSFFLVVTLNISRVRNNRQSVSRLLNMQFQMAMQQEEARDEGGARGEIESEEELEVEGSPEEERAYETRNYLVVKDSAGQLSLKNFMPGRSISTEEILKIAQEILDTKKKSGTCNHYQFEITVGGGDLLIGFTDISSIKKEERQYFVLTLLAALAGGILWFLPAWKLAGKMMEPLNEALRLQKEFILFAGHELKTPVTVMKASLTMLRKEGCESKYLDYVEAENEKMEKLVLELLDYSKLEYQEGKIHMEKMNLSDCVEGAALEFDALAFEKGLLFRTEIEEKIEIMGNSDQLQRMTETLIENGLRHTEAGKEVRICLYITGKRAVLAVQNQGEEIPEEERKRIFEKFYHSPGQEEAEGHHYGLGLAIAQTIAGQHGTEIAVYSENGWNRFEVSFPVLG